MQRHRFLPIVALVIIGWTSPAIAEVSHLVSFQGFLTDTSGPVNGAVDLTIEIYGSESGDDLLWEQRHADVGVTNGIYRVYLGDPNTGGPAFDASLFNSADLWLQVSIGAPSGVMGPRQRITSVVSSLRSEEADRVAPGAIVLESLDPNMCQDGDVMLKTASGWACRRLPIDLQPPIAVAEILDANGAPLGAIGNRISFGDGFMLSGRSSTDVGGGSVVEYEWTRLTGGGGTESIPLDSPIIITQPEFIVPAGHTLALGSHDFRLRVTDDTGNVSEPDIVTLIVVDTSAPTAVLDGPSSVSFGDPIALSGRRSSDTGGGSIVEYEWTRLSGTGGGAVMPVGVPVLTAVPDFTVPVTPADTFSLGRHDFQLRVVDDSGNVSLPDVLSVLVVDTQRPTAVLDGPSSVSFGDPIALSGRRSSDTGGGSIVEYEWTRLTGEGGDVVMPVGSPITTLEPEFIIPSGNEFAVGSHDFQLRVTDNSGNISTPDIIRILVIAPL